MFGFPIFSSISAATETKLKISWDRTPISKPHSHCYSIKSAEHTITTQHISFCLNPFYSGSFKVFNSQLQYVPSPYINIQYGTTGKNKDYTCYLMEDPVWYECYITGVSSNWHFLCIFIIALTVCLELASVPNLVKTKSIWEALQIGDFLEMYCKCMNVKANLKCPIKYLIYSVMNNSFHVQYELILGLFKRSDCGQLLPLKLSTLSVV